jgi:hypothetical protein
MILNDLSPRMRPIVRVIDDWVTARRLGLVFEARLGSAKLLVCSIDLRRELDENPVARQMLLSLYRYMNSDQFLPSESVSLKELRGLVAAK